MFSLENFRRDWRLALARFSWWRALNFIFIEDVASDLPQITSHERVETDLVRGPIHVGELNLKTHGNEQGR
ncbi:hypothetical protein Plhal304r1_c028g0092911 [Plasmopara halstedii]